MKNVNKCALWAWITITACFWLAWLIAYIIFGGNCPMVRTQPGFNTDQYIGRWYEIFRDYSVPFE